MSGINENLLMSVSIDLLYDGMVVEDDIYDSTRDRLLVTSGNKLNEVQIERIKKLNSGRSNIYVTGRTHKAMVAKRPNIEIENRTDVEEATGYAESKDETFELLENIAKTKTVSMDSLRAVSNDLSDRIASTPPAVILSIINAMAPIDEYLQRHSVNVGFLNGLIGRWMGLSESDIDRLVLIGLLHDCGKTLIPPKILNAPRKLTLVEYEVVKKHADYAYDLLEEFPVPIRLAASSHHERINGSGYPNKLADEHIMLEARITAVSDTYDAMVAQRAHRGPLSPFYALAHLNSLSTSEFDSEIVRVFIENIPKDLLEKPVMMSDGTIGVVREFDLDDIEYPKVELSGRVIKSNENLYIVSMFTDE